MKRIAAFFFFWYDFIVGDSWQLALGVLLAVGAARLMVVEQPQLKTAEGILFALALIAIFAGVLHREQRRSQ